MTTTECDYVRCDREADYTTDDGGAFCLTHYAEKMRLANITEGYAEGRG